MTRLRYGLVALAIALTLGPWLARAQTVIIKSGSVNVAHVSSALHIAGTVAVNCVTGCSSSPGATVTAVSHISAVTHIASAGVFPVQQGPAGGELWPVRAHQGGAWSTTVAHVSAQLHVVGAGGALAVNQMGTWFLTAHQGTGWDHLVRQGSAGTEVWPVRAHQGGTWNVAANQSNAWSVTAHQGTGWDHLVRQGSAGAEVWPVRAHQGGTWNVSANQSNAWAVTAHQGGAWNVDKVSHVTSVMAHVIGTVTTEGRGTAGTAAGGVLTVQGVSGMTPLKVDQNTLAWTIAHISSVTHVAAHQGTFSANQTGAWFMTAHQGTGWDHLVRQGAAGTEVWPVRAHQGGAWNVDKLSHVTSVMAHVIGTVTAEGRGTAGTAAGGVVTVQGAANMTPLRVDQNSLAWNIAHITSVMHVVVTKDMTGTRGNQTCHSQANFVTSASGIIAHGAAGARLYICSLVLGLSGTGVAANTTFSLVEGTAAACGTNTAALLGSTAAVTGLRLNLHGASYYSVTAPTPWLSTQTAANQICLLVGNAIGVAGVMTYGAY